MAGQNPGSPTDFQYFYEDEVYKINNRGQVVFGLVVENYEVNSDQEDDFETPIEKGEIRVVWHPSGVERVIPEKSVGLADRSLMPGDVVRRLIAGKDTQRGYCRDVTVTAAVQIVGTKHVIPSVSTERLHPLEKFTPALVVCLDSWIGTTESVHNKYRLVSSDGSRVEFPELAGCPLEDFSTRNHISSSCSTNDFYYPGQVLYGPIGALDSANWLHMTKEMKASRKHKSQEHKFTIEAIVLDKVVVHWQCKAMSPSSCETNTPTPKSIVEGDDLKRLKDLNLFESCTLQVGDVTYLTIQEDDVFTTKKQWLKSQSKLYQNERRSGRSKRTQVTKVKELNTENTATTCNNKTISNSVKSKKKTSLDNSITCCNEPKKDTNNIESEQQTTSCPHTKLNSINDSGLNMENTLLGLSQSNADSTIEEKNDSGISPEPNDRAELFDESDNNWESTSSGDDSDLERLKKSKKSDSITCSPQLAVKLLKGKRLKRARRKPPPLPRPAVDAKVVVKTLCTTSKANVVWQDGTIEMNIPSTELYPIHHLDGQECFPGDFVVSGTNADEGDNPSYRDYGVVQKVDHHGRTAIVKWYKTYTNFDKPIPQLMGETEVSVYDLKDHPDFQYRPATAVIRVANFTGTDVDCTAGQVIDNCPSGQVHVKWIDGHSSMCWPQDLYKVGEYDSDEGELWDDASASDDSWETQSSVAEVKPDSIQVVVKLVKTQRVRKSMDVVSYPKTRFKESIPHVYSMQEGADATPNEIKTKLSLDSVPRLLEPKFAALMERSRRAVHKLEDMFSKDPSLQSQETLRKLLSVYKDCKQLDRLLGTTFFHQDNSLELVERLKSQGSSTPTASERRLHQHLARLFSQESQENTDPSMEIDDATIQEMDDLMTNNEVEHKEPFSLSMDSTMDCSQQMELANTQLPTKPDTLLLASSSASKQDGSGGSDETTRNLCYKLCNLIHSKLIKAHAEVSRRRPAQFAQFLNDIITEQNTNNEKKLPFHFSVQHNALVVESTESKKGDTGNIASNEVNKTDINDKKIVTQHENNEEEVATEIIEEPPLAPLAMEETIEPDLENQGGEGFTIMESPPTTHRFRLSILQPSQPKSFFSAVRREVQLLKNHLPPGVWVRGFEERSDLLSMMIAGPVHTPYEAGLFLFDIQLGAEFPRTPPLCHYISYCSDRLNPNLYEDGKVCVSLLGTWSGRGVEVWSKNSTLLQVIVSLQGLILNSEPYFNEAGYEKQKGSQQGLENSRMYNEMVLLKLVQSMTKMLNNPPEIFRDEIIKHLRTNAASLCKRLEGWAKLSGDNQLTDIEPPAFPLIPASRGFCLTLKTSLEAFRAALRKFDIIMEPLTL